MEFPKPYRLADRAILQLNRTTANGFERVRQKLKKRSYSNGDVFSELNALFAELIRENLKKFRELYRARYFEILDYFGEKHPVGRDFDESIDEWLSMILSEPSDVTHYTYDAEVLRKRDRAIESINSMTARSEKEYELDKAMRLWTQQTGFYIDIISDDAALRAMKSVKGDKVDRVMWMTKHDPRVCKKCRALDGHIFDIENVPPKQHPRCRCWLKPVED